MWLGLIAFCMFPIISRTLASTNAIPEIDTEFQKVTCGSAIKLTHQMTGYKIHSHGVNYGTGSMQQSVTGFKGKDDPNSFWMVFEAHGELPCKNGQTFKCGSHVRLQHVGTSKYLHSHLHQSPLSSNQEVSAFDGQDGIGNKGDNWQVKCATDFWRREKEVELVHQETSNYLSASTSYVYRSPIPGQLEVHASRYSGKGSKWIAQEGIYFADESVA